MKIVEAHCQSVYKRYEEKLVKLCNKALRKIYGKQIPGYVIERVGIELEAIKKLKLTSLYLLAGDIVNRSNKDRFRVTTRGCVANSYVCYLLGITKINPLDKNYHLPYESLFGCNFDKEVSFDLNFANVYVDKVKTYLSNNLGINQNNAFDRLEILNSTDLDVIHLLEKITKKKLVLDDDTTKEALDFISNESVCVFASYYRNFGKNYCEMDSIKKLKPSTIEELIKISAMSHSTYGYIKGTKKTIRDLVLAGELALEDAITCREDLFEGLIKHGIERLTAYEITRAVRMGKVCRGRCVAWDDYKQIMINAGIDEEYIKQCESIEYLFPRAHCIEVNNIRLLLAMYQKRYPLQFHATYWAFVSNDVLRAPDDYEEEMNKAGVDSLELFELKLKMKDMVLGEKY